MEPVATSLTARQRAFRTAPRLLLSLVYRERGDLDAASEQAEALVEIAEHSTPEGHPKRAIALVGLGEVLLARGETEAALAQFDRALSIRREALDPGDVRIGYSLAARANALAQLDRDAEALADALAARELFDAGQGTESWRAGVRFTIARVSRDRAAAEEALAIYELLGDGYADEADEVRAWLDERAG